MNITIAKNEEFISIHIESNFTENLSWILLQEIKDKFFSELDFIEVFPKKQEIINKANVRHLIHIKNWKCPKLEDLEQKSEITNITLNL